jgi:hypothetical protein
MCQTKEAGTGERASRCRPPPHKRAQPGTLSFHQCYGILGYAHAGPPGCSSSRAAQATTSGLSPQISRDGPLASPRPRRLGRQTHHPLTRHSAILRPRRHVTHHPARPPSLHRLLRRLNRHRTQDPRRCLHLRRRSQSQSVIDRSRVPGLVSLVLVTNTDVQVTGLSGMPQAGLVAGP